MHFPATGIPSTRYHSQRMLDTIRKHARFFLATGLLGLALRLFLALRTPAVVDDSRLYADIAKNWLHHGIYGITNSGAIMPTLSRLPGYPAFLAAMFWLFGDDNFRAVLLVQFLFDLVTCFLIADTARRIFSDRAAQAAFLLASLCPFLANYAAAALTETLEIFFTVLAINLAFRGFSIGGAPKKPHMIWLACGLAIAGAILLRPDGGILLAAIGLYILWRLLREVWPKTSFTHAVMTPSSLFLAGVLVATGALAPLIPWTIRNLHTLHRFQPLAPRYANDSDELVMKGFNLWVKTWMADYVSVQEIYWPVPGEEIDFSRLPARAFNSPQQRDETQDLFAEYNANHDMTPELDARFGQLASQRIANEPLRYYFGLPLMRIADMWLRPRTELFPSDPRWWEFNDDPRWLTLSLAFGTINLAYVIMGFAGFLRTRAVFGIGLLLSFIVLRSLFLGTLENPEPRYTLECYPALIVAASALFRRRC